MGRITKKGKAGAAVAFVTRNKAMKRLQLTLKDFRRLCILKGIYPVEPKHKKKVNHGSSANKTYYLLKDIQFLSHEPIIWKFWDFKIFMKRITRAKGRKDYETLKNIRENKPFYKVDHIVKERYPRFIDAIRDLDDSLSMCFLYSMFPKSQSIPLEMIEMSRRLTLEFMHFIIETKSLRKVFVSIKGYYYQADVMGQTVTWIVPHQFMFDRITDVDFQVMKTFTHFYITLMGFVNFKLYASVNLFYPPKLVNKSIDSTKMSDEDIEDIDEQIAALNQPLVSCNAELDQLAKPDEFDDVQDNEEKAMTFHQIAKFQKLFEGFKFFLNREVPRESLVFVIRSFGGVVSWDKTLFSGATYSEDDTGITHQIVDRDILNTKYLNRYYIQPQWVYDCVNAKMLLPVEDYFMGETLPPHLSPFVEEKPGDYIPPEKQSLIRMQEGVEDEEEMDNEDIDVSEKTEKKQVDEQVGLVKAGQAKKANKHKMAKDEAAEEKRLAVMMIPKKKKRLYEKIIYGQKRNKRENETLKKKREEYEANKNESDKKKSNSRYFKNK